MATILYRNAKVLIDSADVSASLSELSVEYTAEMLDETTFGDDTRIKKGGLKTAKISGKGFLDTSNSPVDPANNVDAVLFNQTGVDDVLVTVFADGITEGTLTDRGFSMKGVLSEFKIGETVGQILTLNFSVEARGISA